MNHFVLMFLFSVLYSVVSGTNQTEDFAHSQKKFQRVRAAYANHEAETKKELQLKNLNLSKLELAFIAYKAEDKLMLYARNRGDKKFILFKQYKICAKSGKLGPKRKQGDMQVPEGLYHIDRFNPSSLYHLSLGINYPNASDRVLANKASPGGDIFIHGECVTIGCLPMTNKVIEQIYLLAVEAKNAGQKKIPMYIFPFEMNEANLKKYSAEHQPHEEFWKNLQKAYTFFEDHRTEIPFIIDTQGKYRISGTP
ncbi:MAG: murein L,D-transpeptidase family protein [Flavobacteriales bacterium]